MPTDPPFKSGNHNFSTLGDHIELPKQFTFDDDDGTPQPNRGSTIGSISEALSPSVDKWLHQLKSADNLFFSIKKPIDDSNISQIHLVGIAQPFSEIQANLKDMVGVEIIKLIHNSEADGLWQIIADISLPNLSKVNFIELSEKTVVWDGNPIEATLTLFSIAPSFLEQLTLTDAGGEFSLILVPQLP